MTATPPIFPILPTSTIVPTDESLYITYFNQLYEQFANTINLKDNTFYPMAISSTATNILNLPNFGSFIICVSGVDSTLPTKTASLCKADATAAGSVTGIGAQVGTGAWAGNQIIISSTATNFQIRHDRAGITANFNLRIIGTK